MNIKKDNVPGGRIIDRGSLEHISWQIGPELTGIVGEAGDLLNGKYGPIPDQIKPVLESIRQHAIKANTLKNDLTGYLA